MWGSKVRKKFDCSPTERLTNFRISSQCNTQFETLQWTSCACMDDRIAEIRTQMLEIPHHIARIYNAGGLVEECERHVRQSL